MDSNSKEAGQAAELHRLAEVKAWSGEALVPDSCSPKKMRMLVHELKVRQIELEMQNEELRRTQEELDAVNARYFDLYDLAPVGYFTVSEKGLILEANLTAATLLGMVRSAIVNLPVSRVIVKEDQDVYYSLRRQLLKTETPQTCELRLVKSDGTLFWAHLKAILVQDPAGSPVCRIVVSDMAGDRRAERS